jgi:hypothetical protein
MDDMYYNTFSCILSIAANPIRYCGMCNTYLCSSCNGRPGIPGKELAKFEKFKSYRIIYFIILQTAVSKLKFGQIYFVCVRLHSILQLQYRSNCTVHCNCSTEQIVQYIATAVQTEQIELNGQ